MTMFLKAGLARLVGSARLVGLASLALMAGLVLVPAAQAADLPYRKGGLPPAPVLPDFYSWTGLYAGGQIGYSWGSERTRFAALNGAFATSYSYDTDSVVGGGHVGFNYQLGSFVVGVEGDVEAVGSDGSFADAFARGGVKRDWQASVRGRLGFAMDRFMIYATGGVSFTEFDQHFFDPATGGRDSTQTSRSGWTAGAGVSYAFTDHLIAGVEYRYTDYGRFDRNARNAFLGLATDHDSTLHTVRTSLSYKF